MSLGTVVGEAPPERRRWLSVLAKALPRELVEAWDELKDRPAFTALRKAETGLVLVRGRMGGTGDAFNVGEMTVTRAAVRLPGGETGVGYVGGRDKRHAELAAAVDAMMQSPTLRERAQAIVERLARQQQARRDAAARKAAATRVDFFTMVRMRSPD
jgi:alpha-D-ribose 1-methylphosphonate 5-triphosphate synthase subunit PhnG